MKLRLAGHQLESFGRDVFNVLFLFISWPKLTSKQMKKVFCMEYVWLLFGTVRVPSSVRSATSLQWCAKWPLFVPSQGRYSWVLSFASLLPSSPFHFIMGLSAMRDAIFMYLRNPWGLPLVLDSGQSTREQMFWNYVNHEGRRWHRNHLVCCCSH